MAEGLVSTACSGLDNSARGEGFAKSYLTCVDCQLAAPQATKPPTRHPGGDTLSEWESLAIWPH